MVFPNFLATISNNLLAFTDLNLKAKIMSEKNTFENNGYINDDEKNPSTNKIIYNKEDYTVSFLGRGSAVVMEL